ncbi:hypothetical protein [Segetibacter aerophilus]|uniref:Lipoprotein n=1 Tax=Segetibacter aerophilus TaxID=670293 RepID=A0A512BCH9_9BACT|nr:hypothetical protein [Segetibacter aerophilus]GEO09605.1 hypothetical protein SAE01_21010 [Segetibacter aerophilus]
MTKSATLAATVLVAILFNACSPFRISVSNELSAAAEMPVKGKNGIMINQKLSFGEYRTEKINRSWTEGNSINGGAMKVLWATYSQKKQSIHFSLKDTVNNRSEVFCLAKTRSEDWTVGESPNSLFNIMGDLLGVGGKSDNTFAVNIYLSKEPAPWELMLDVQKAQANSKRYVGFLAQNKDNYYTLHPITSVEKNGKKGSIPIGSVGYEIRSKGGVALAAVSLMDQGKVYIGATDPKERFLLANACSALLLHEVM